MKEIHKVHGPYTRKDMRQHVVIMYKDGTRRTQSYPRYLMEEYLGRELEDFEEVDHIDEDKSNTILENLQLLNKLDNIKKSARGMKIYYFNCVYCSKSAAMSYKQYKGNQIDKKCAGPYCSRECAGKIHN